MYALPHQAERRLAAATPGGRQQVHGSVAGEKGYQEIHEQIPGNLSNEYGAELQQPSGTIPLSRGRENICIATRRNAEEHSVEPFVRENAKRLQGRGDRNTKDNDGQRSRSPHDDSTGVPAQGGRWPNAEMNNHEMMVELATKNDQTQILMMEFRDVETPKNK